MDRVRSFTELSEDEKDEISLLVSKKTLDPAVGTVENFPDDALLRICKRALREQQGEFHDLVQCLLMLCFQFNETFFGLFPILRDVHRC